MNKFKNKWIFIIAILVIILGIFIFNNKDNISKLIGVNARSVTEENNSNKIFVCNKAPAINPYILAAYEYNDTVKSGKAGYCIAGTEDTCVETKCYKDNNYANSCEAGTIIKYQVNNDEIYYFNVLHDDGGAMTLQSVDAITQSAWNSAQTNKQGPISALTAITEATKDWTNVNDLTYTLGETVFLKYPNNSDNANPYTDCNYSYGTCTINSYNLSSNLTSNVKARMLSVQEALDVGCKFNIKSCPNWLNNNDYENYWTLNSYGDAGGYTIYNKCIYDAGYVTINKSLKAVVEINK
jgi:hypothetical protein